MIKTVKTKCQHSLTFQTCGLGNEIAPDKSVF